MKRITTILLLLFLCATAHAQFLEGKQYYFKKARITKGDPHYAKRYKEHYIKEHGLHILLPVAWSVKHLQPDTLFEIEHKEPLREQSIILAHSESDENESINFDLTIRANIPLIFLRDTVFYRSITTVDTSVNKQVRSTKYPSTMVAFMHKQWKMRSHSTLRKEKLKGRVYVHILHNNDVFLLSFYAYNRQLKNNIPMFFDVINSVYFDK